MRDLTDIEREKRDQVSAGLAIKRARERGETVGIAVDNEPKMDRMLNRVLALAASRGLRNTVIHQSGWVEILFDNGRVRIFAADRAK